MISRKYKKILRRYLEGDLTDNDKNQFERELAENSELRSCLEDMNELDRALAESAASLPGPDLLEPIMNSVMQYKNAHERNTGSEYARIFAGTSGNSFSRFFPSPQWNLAWGFIAGLIVGVTVLSLFHTRQPSGTVTEMDATGTFARKDMKGIVLLPVDLPDVKLNLSANPLPQNFTQLNLEVISDASSIIQLMFNTTSFQVWSLRSMESKPGCQIMAGYNYVEIGNQGQNSYVILLKKLTTIEEELTVSIFLDGNLEFNTLVKI